MTDSTRKVLAVVSEWGCGPLAAPSGASQAEAGILQARVGDHFKMGNTL